ncbi:hypothetical protein Asppvi_006043 [Aspergillus pseudoviridinutans]|uniref:Uncharacterized protein n=1 Tax=Aspergillus pseudoviridinutans TaxID=1517512 RepID=A0A9P3BC08_9EURO|nr:uncharacterized protein Asppvi_006043 [Aspergillus pseudoviridinutans]GIJ87139.1 hypothetical protein Asppvi_006043 [Aspergillus pseudoviridinutans]
MATARSVHWIHSQAVSTSTVPDSMELFSPPSWKNQNWADAAKGDRLGSDTLTFENRAGRLAETMPPPAPISWATDQDAWGFPAWYE